MLQTQLYQWFTDLLFLLPLNRGRGLACYIIHYAVDSLNLVYNAGGHSAQHIQGDSCPVGGHEVGCGNSAQGNCIIISAGIPHHTHRAHVGDNGKILINVALQSGFGDFFSENSICLAKNRQPFGRNRTNTAYRKSWSGEGLTPYDIDPHRAPRP